MQNLICPCKCHFCNSTGNCSTRLGCLLKRIQGDLAELKRTLFTHANAVYMFSKQRSARNDWASKACRPRTQYIRKNMTYKAAFPI